MLEQSKTAKRATVKEVKIDDDLHSLVDTSTICTAASESVQLSLPDNFDDVFSINGISIPPVKCTSAEVRLLHAQIADLRSQVKFLTNDRDACLRSLQRLDVNSIFQNGDEFRETHEGKRNLVQNVALILRKKLLTHHDELRRAMDKAKITSDIAEQQKEKASNTQIICDQRIQNLEEALEAANERRKEADDKCKYLQDELIETEEKGRKFDDLSSQHQTLECERKRLKSVIDQMQKDVESTKVESATNKTKVKDLSSQIHALEMDKSFIEKEKVLLLQRIEEAEKRSRDTALTLSEANSKCDDLSLQLVNANAVAKAESDGKASSEIKRIRTECDDELKRYRTQVETSYKRELSILKDAKDDAMKQNSEAQSEIKKLRDSLDSMTAQKDETISRLEKSLSDCRSDVKVKCIESSKLLLCNEQLEENVRVLQSEVEMLSAQVAAHKNEFKNLEQESCCKRRQLMVEIERKDEQLEMYYQSHKLSLESKEGGKVKSYISANEGSAHHFLEKAKQLEKKNSDLLKAIYHLKKEMKRQSEETTRFQMKLKSAEEKSESLKNELKGAIDDKCVESGTSNNLKFMNQALTEDLHQARKEIDRLSNEYNYLTTKYNHLMKNGQQEKENLNLSSRRHSRNVQIWKIDGKTKVATPVKVKNGL